ncbi:MAG: 1,2-epoxyphenylacetyl-CoA isomerase [Pseudomonadota bacterium]|jgi:enoyl-CoA hydratase/carnithine racemase
MILTISNPDARNALGPGIYAAGIEALNIAADQREVLSVIITGEGPHFSAGGNLQRLLDNRSKPPEHQATSIDTFHAWIECLATFPKPVIAAVEGACAGAGFSLVLACDLVVASSESIFSLAYSNVGLSPDGGATWQLAHKVPRHLANQWLMLGERLPATTLLERGLINQVCAPGLALTQALALAEQLNARAGNVLGSIKELLAIAQDKSLGALLDAERDHLVRNLHHANGGIGIQAFLDKTTPRYAR